MPRILIPKTLVFSLMILFGSFTSTNVRAFEPPNPTVENTLLSGQAAFTARVIKLEERRREEFQTVSEATLELIHCYYGVDCSEPGNVTLQYVSDTILEGALSVAFDIGDEILFALNKPIISRTTIFDSDWKEGIDMAYIVGRPSRSGYRDYTLRLINIYLPSVTHRIAEHDLERWANERATQLKRAADADRQKTEGASP